jgi:hypothetical protein
MTPNNQVAGCLGRCPSPHLREERTNTLFVSGVPVVSALVGLVELGRGKFGRGGRQEINARPAAGAETGETSRLQQANSERLIGAFGTAKFSWQMYNRSNCYAISLRNAR